MTSETPRARMILIGGASGSGKSRIAEESGLPLLRLDDFYRDGDDPALPRLSSGEVDWDHAGSWHAERALAAAEELATTGRVEVPVYDIATSRATGTHTVELGGASVFVAEGVFVAEMVELARGRGILADAVCVRRSRWLTMALRFARDLRENRKSPAFLVKRGLILARREPGIVAHLAAAGCRPLRVRRIRALLADVVSA
ncbi:ATP-binding protein [Microbacterium sp. G2-8]|uniref:ATP-binding protein n=1 Tax=Microbacterium sp. G2-8 TaxID=2842454 RepID=UPI001C8A300E|nr:ATP-binding protein [Microbacterium sp. G2-8]